MNGSYSNPQGSGFSSDLQKYIKDALDSGATREEIERVLLESGWPKEKIDEAFFNLNTASYQQAGFQQSQLFQGQYQGTQPPYGGYIQQPQFQGYPQQAGVPYYTGYAGFWIRVLAAFIDGAVMFLISLPIVGLVTALSSGGAFAANGEFSSNRILISLLSLIVNWLYFALTESSGNQATLGKMACGLKVADLNGQRISFGKATARYFAKYFISGTITFGIGYIIAGFDQKKQGLHDKIVGTLVLKK